MALKASPDRTAIENWWRQNLSEYHRTVMEFRRAKEDFFSDENYWRSAPPMEVKVKPYWISETNKVKLEASLTPADFEAAISTPVSGLGDQAISWRDRYRADLNAAKQSIQEIIGKPPSFIILTGGAARMDFVETVAKEVFSSPTDVKRASEPEHAISTGLAIAGSIRYRTQEFHNEIRSIIDSTKVEDIISQHIKSFAEVIAHAISKDATERFIIPEFITWKRSGVGKLRDVAERISKRMETWSKSDTGREHTLKALVNWYKVIETELHELTVPVCMKYNLATDALDIPKSLFDPRQPKVPTNPDEVMFSTARIVLSAIIATVSFVIGAVLFGGGTAILLPTGPFAPIIIGVVLWVAGEAGKEWAVEKAMDMTIPGWLRKLYPESWLRSNLQKKAAETEEKIRTEIVRSIVGDYPDSYPEKGKMENSAKQHQAEIIKKVTAGIEMALKQRSEEVSILIS
jgi:hypothetical protein